jgi:hypothetical protein
VSKTKGKVETDKYMELIPPEQWVYLGGAIVAMVVTIAWAIGYFVKWSVKHHTAIQDWKFKQQQEEWQAQQDEKKREDEMRSRELNARYEVVEKSMMLLGDATKRHAEIDERHINVQSQATETLKQLASSAEALTSSILRSQSWQEKRSEDTLAEIDVLSERTAGIERTTSDTREKMDTVVTTLTQGLEQIKIKLDGILQEAKKNPNKDALERIEQEIAKLIILAKPLSDSVSRNESTQPLPDLSSTKPLPSIEETKEDKTA